jgi:two-component system LytT family sensor kinase
MCPKEAIWHFSPFVFTGLHRYAWRFLRRFQVDWQVILIAAPVLLELLRQVLGFRFGVHRLFYLGTGTPVMTVAVVVATVLAVAIPIKIWNSARIEHKLQEQDQLLMAARIEALANQINPHFLFNTLTSISSLIRSQPETARVLIVKLSGLLRRLLRSQDHFVTLREELAAIDEYLDIESVRFGSRLEIVKDVAPESLDVVVPSMILQPLVENSLKHGLANKVGDGQLVLRSHLERGHAVVEVIDNGLGRPAGPDRDGQSPGIGLKNVQERLRVIYGTNYRLQLEDVPGGGTRARMEIPELVLSERDATRA